MTRDLGFPWMCDILPESSKGAARIVHYEISPISAVIASTNGIPTSPGRCCILKLDGQTMMSDTENERRSNRHVVREARGDVLIAGLGLGMILHPILAKPEVRTVDVVEKCHGVIDLVKGTLPTAKPLAIIHDSIFTWKPAKGTKWDVIYFDIWPDICLDNLPEMATLHRKFAKRLKPGGYMQSWYRDDLKRWQRRESRSMSAWR